MVAINSNGPICVHMVAETASIGTAVIFGQTVRNPDERSTIVFRPTSENKLYSTVLA